jgi:hypothetical protein
MWLPNDLEALVEMRREDLEREVRLLHMLALASGQRPGWRRRVARLLRWCGSRLTHWGDRLAAGAKSTCVPSTPVVEMD